MFPSTDTLTARAQSSIECQRVIARTAISEATGTLVAFVTPKCRETMRGWSVVTDNATGDDIMFIVCEAHNTLLNEPGERITEQDIDDRCDCDYDSHAEEVIYCHADSCNV